MTQFKGKKVWLIGASEGIGAALATGLASAGARVAISARNQTKLEEILAELGGNGHIALPLNVRNYETVKKAWEMLLNKWNGIDIVIYNAGAYQPMGAQQFNLEEIETMLDVNLSGAFRALSFVLPYFIKQNSGHIAMIGSVAGYNGLPNAIGYGASKAGVIHLAQNLKADLGDTNIKVQLINPGFVDTRLTRKNTFKMPFLITPEKAAGYIICGLASNSFETHFPKRISLILKAFSFLPNPVYFWIMRKIKNL